MVVVSSCREMLGLTPERRKELRELARQHNEKQVAEKTEVKAVLRIRIHSSLIHVVSVDCEDNNLP